MARLIHSYTVQLANEKSNILWRSGLCQQANENKKKSLKTVRPGNSLAADNIVPCLLVSKSSLPLNGHKKKHSQRVQETQMYSPVS
jgi:hypothetical protein